MDKSNVDGVELPEELLEGIAGGAMSASDEKAMRDFISYLKGHGVDKARAGEIYRALFMSEMPAEIQEFINTNW